MFFEDKDKKSEPQINRCFEDKNMYNEIILTKDGQKEDYAKVMGETIFTLLREGEWVKVRTDDGNTDIIIIEHNHDENLEYWGGPTLHWISDKEEDLLYNSRINERYEAAGFEVDEWGNTVRRIKDKTNEEEE